MSKYINVCICTYKRPEIIATLESIESQCLPKEVILKVIIADNDEVDSARERIKKYARSSQLEIEYVHAPKHNISIARNTALDHVDADWVAIIDDDEIASETWISDLIQCQESTQADVVFGPAIAQYPDSAPTWMKEGDYHSNRITKRSGIVQTGHTCNVLMRWGSDVMREQRFLPDKGRSGGEDTEFFFRLWRLGVKLELCESALVYEPIHPERLNIKWIKKRKIRSGQSYAYHSTALTLLSRLKLGFISVVKIIYCFMFMLFKFNKQSEQKFWYLRAYFHLGVLGGVLNLREDELY